MIPFELTRPWALSVLLVAVPTLVLFFVRSLSDFPRRQRIVSLVMRTLIVLLLVLSLAGLALLRKTDERFFIFLIDQSLSLGKNGLEKADEFLDEALRHIGEHRVAFLPFAAEVGSVQEERVNFTASESSNGEEGSVASADSKPDADFSEICWPLPPNSST